MSEGRRTYRVRIPAKPVAKGRARVSKQTGVPYTPKQTVVAESWVRLCVVQAVGTPRVAGPVAVRVVFVMPVPKTMPKAKRKAVDEGRILPTSKPDWDNLAKLVSDALNGIAWVDDAEVARAEVVKVYGPEPCTIVEWWHMGEAEASRVAAAAIQGAPDAPAELAAREVAGGLL